MSDSSSRAPLVLSPICIAPMVDVTDRHWRWLFRRLTRRVKLYTDMKVDDAVVNTDRLWSMIGTTGCEDPVAVQLGGSDPETMANAALIAQSYGNYCEINVNVGCPSPKACKNQFGARLMRDPDRVRQIVSAISRRATTLPVTVKCRIGVDGNDSYDALHHFVAQVKAGGANHVIVHARTCFLDGLSPAQNRNVPPLKHHLVHRLVTDFPDMTVCINGGITTFDQARQHLGGGMIEGSDVAVSPVHEVMMGRAAWHNPWLFRSADQEFWAESPPTPATRRSVIEEYLDYCERVLDPVSLERGFPMLAPDCEERVGREQPDQVPLYVLLRPLNYILAGMPGGRAFRRTYNQLYEHEGKKGRMNFTDLVTEALTAVPNEVLDAVV